MENQDQILQYTEFLNAINPPDVYGELIEYAKENHVPIMEPVGINFLCQIVQIQQPRCAIEIGTAIGYSAIRLAHVCPQMYIYTFERDADRVFQAKSMANGAKSTMIALCALATPNQPITPR